MAERRIVENIRGMAWTYEYNDNKIDGSGMAEDSLTFRLWAVDIYGSISEGYDEISVVNPAPAPVIIDAKAIMQGVRFSWDPSPETDFSHYVYRIRVETGVWSNWAETSVSIVDRFLTPEENALYTGEAQIYIEVYVVDTWGNTSAIAAADEESISFIVKPHNIDDFAVEASKIWVNLPVLEGDVWYANSPSSGYVRWEAHRLYLNGVKYDISAGSTNKKYIYWVKPNTTYSSSDNNPKGGIKEGVEYPDLLGNNGWVIAVNISGVYDLAWNAIANQIIGSAYIEDASIVSANIGTLQVNNAHVYGDLDASKIISGDLRSQNWSAVVGSRFRLNDGTFQLGGSSAPALEWDGSQLTLRGAILQTSGGSFPMPVYRGTYSSGTQYYIGDLVVYDGGSWICIQDIRGTAPSSETPGTNYWDVWAAKGEPGDMGAAGDTGPGVAYRGEWVPDTTYAGGTLIRDVVKYSGYFYICQFPHGAAGYSWVGASGYGNVAPGAIDSSIYPNTSPALCHKLYINLSVPSGGSTAHVAVGVYYEGGWHYLTDRIEQMGANLYFDLGGTKSVTAIAVWNKHSQTIRVNALQVTSTSGSNVPPNRTDLWTAFGASFSSVATDLLLANDIAVLRSITFGDAGTKSGAIHSYGKSSYGSSQAGFFIGWDGGVPKVNIGDANKWIRWTGATLDIGGDIVATGNILGNAVSQTVVDTNVSGVNLTGYSLGTKVTLASVTLTVVSGEFVGVLVNANVTVKYGGIHAQQSNVALAFADTSLAASSYTYTIKAAKDLAVNGPTHIYICRGGTVVSESQCNFIDVDGFGGVGTYGGSWVTNAVITAVMTKR